MASVTTMTLYLGAGETGSRLDHLIQIASTQKKMKKSEFVVWLIEQYLKENGLYSTPAA